jgi:hypothetical protein
MKRKIAAVASVAAIAVISAAVFVKMNQYTPTYEWTYDAKSNMAFVMAHDEERGLLSGTPKDPTLVPALMAVDGNDPEIRFYPPKQPKVCNVTNPKGDYVTIYYGRIDVTRSHSLSGRIHCNTDSVIDSKYKVYYTLAREESPKVFERGGPNSVIIEHQIFSLTGLDEIFDVMAKVAAEKEAKEEAAKPTPAPAVESTPAVEPAPVVAAEPVPVVEPAPVVPAADDKPFVATDTWVIIGSKHYTTAVNSKGDAPTALVRTESPLVGIVYTMVRPKDGRKCEKFDSRTEAGWGTDGVNFNTVFFSVQCTDKLGPNYETVHVYTDSDADAIDEAVKGAEAAKQNVTVDNVEFPTQGFTLTRNAM